MKLTPKEQQDELVVRLDKWLWAARFFKTRALAKAAIEGGKVQYEGQRCKPGKHVELEANLTVKQGWEEKRIVVKGLEDRRKSAKEAVLLYEETQESIQLREERAWQRKHMQMAHLPPARRPTKRQRRQIIRFKDQDYGQAEE